MVQKEELEVELEGGQGAVATQFHPLRPSSLSLLHHSRQSVRLPGTSRASSGWEWHAGMRSAVHPSYREWGSECGHEWPNVTVTL